MPRSVKRNPLVQVIIDYTIITLACIGTALVIQLFQLPNHFVFGGVTGMAVLLSSVTPVGFSSWNILINLILILAGFVFLGKSFGIRTVYVSVFTSLCYKVLDYIFPVGEPLTDQPFLETLLVTFTIAALAAILFDRGACSGGTDILAMILKRRTTLEIGRALLLVDIGIVTIAAFLYGPRVGLYCVLGLFAKTLVVDKAIESIHLRKVCTIICSEPRKVEEFIVKHLNRTATISRGYGAFSGKCVTVIMSVLSRREAVQLRRSAREIDPGAFITIVDSSEIVGKGFRGTN